MPVNRIINQINLRKSDSVIMIYGQVNDTFVTSDLALYNVDGIEKILCRYLRENGYEQIIFYAPERQLYVYDEQSYRYCFPEVGVDAPSTSILSVADSDSRPLGNRKVLRANSTGSRPITGSDAATYSTSSSVTSSTTTNTPRWHREGFISVVQGRSDIAILDIIREALFQNKRKSAVIFSQFDNPEATNEIQRNLNPLIPRLQRRLNDNKCIIITNAVDQQKLNEVVNGIPSLNKIIKMEEAGKGLDSLIYISYPQKDEIRNLLNRMRITNNIPVDWSQFERLVVGLDQGRDELKRWEREFFDIERLDIINVNKGLQHPISEDGHSAFDKLDSLIGLNEIKLALHRYFLQIRDLRENSPGEKPLMHIVLKGNPGTGKTTMARLISEIFREEGLLERGHLVEVDREKLVAGYIGQTAMKTDSCCREAIGGVLFVDEAYALAPRENNNGGGSSQDFGKEAIDTLIKRMTDWQDRFCVILAGYPDDMDRLLAANPGFTGRIGLTLVIEDYKAPELTQIFCQRAVRSKRIVTEYFESAILNVFTNIYIKRGKKFDNARTVEQLITEISGLHLERCIRDRLDRKDTPFELEDIPMKYAKSSKPISTEGDAMERLKGLIGLEMAKQQVLRQVALIRAEKEMSGVSQGRRLHLIFKGNPGTGKTTMARLLGEIYQHYQILPNNNFLEVSRKDLVGGYQGQTATKVEEKCKEALGGILFIDEAYSLVNADNDSYGKEAVDTLLKIMEDERENFCVIMAGYPDKMSDFLDTNPGLRRRFSAEIEFEDYNAEQLLGIFKSVVHKKGIQLDTRLEERMPAIWRVIVDRKDENFGNAGEVENLVQRIIENLAVRVLNNNLEIKKSPAILEDIPKEIIELLPVHNADSVIDEALAELNALVGLASVKNHVKGLVREYKYDRMRLRRDPNLKLDKRNYHMIFKGNPGTGKTTVARIMGKIFKALDILKEGNVVEVTRGDFIAGFQGQTAEKTKKLVQKSFDNILFIDEAYALMNSGTDSFGQEAIDTLLKMMEDYRDRVVVIAAGYPREMRGFLRTNSGLASRFPNEINFADYEDGEMLDILKLNIKYKGLQLAEGLNDSLMKHLRFLKAQKSTDFGNARDVKHFLDKVIMPLYMNRVEDLPEEDETFWTIVEEDLPPAPNTINPDEAANKSKASEFSPQQEKNDQRNSTAQISHSGGGDLVKGDKITHNYINSTEEVDLREWTEMPEIDSSKIYDRANEIEDMHRVLFGMGQSNKVLLYGLPGAGKTKTIVKFIATYQQIFPHIIWLNINVSIAKTLIENQFLQKKLKVDFSEGQDDDLRYQLILEGLKKMPTNCLLVLDNLPQSEMETLKRLALPNFKIIVATHERADIGKPVLIGPLPDDAALALFNDICPARVEAEALNELFAPVSNHALAIEVLAKILANHPNMAFETLLEKVRSGLHVRDRSVNNTGNIEVIDTFKMLFQLAELSADEQKYLILFSLLPAYPLQLDFIHELFYLENIEQKDEFFHILSSLIRKGLIAQEKSQGYYCHQIIQQICRDQFAPDELNASVLMLAFGQHLGMKIDDAIAGAGIFSLATVYLPLLEYFMSHFDKTILLHNRISINLSVLYRINGQFEESVEISLKEKHVLDSQRSDFPHLFNIICRNLAFSEACKGDYAAAERHYEEGVTFLEEVYHSAHNAERHWIEQELLLTYAQLGQLQLRIEKHDVKGAISYFEKGREIVQQATEISPIASAGLLEGLAMAYIEQSDYEPAIQHLLQSKKLLIEGQKVDKTSLPIGYLETSLGLAYAGVKNFENARFHIDEGLSILKKHLPEDSFEFYRAYNISGIVYMQCVLHKVNDNGEDVEIYRGMLESGRLVLEKAIELLTKNRGEEHEDLAMMYSNLGLVLKFMGKHEEGYKQHQRGVAIYNRMEHKNDLVAGMYFRSMIFFEQDLGKEEAELYLLNCLNIISNVHENLLDIGFIHYCLAIVKHGLDKSRDALVSSAEALKCVRKFHGKETNVVGTDKDSPLEVVCLQQIASISADIGGLGEYTRAIEYQQEAIAICEANMRLDDDELGDPYLLMAKIFLKAAKELEDMKLYADSLEYKYKVNAINPKLLKENPELDDSGEFFAVKLKDSNGKFSTQYVVIPNACYSLFDIDYRAGKVTDLSQYGYVVELAKGSVDFLGTVKIYTNKYGPLKSYDGNV